MGPLLSATIAKKKDPKKPGKCAIIPALVIPVVFYVQLLLSLLAKPSVYFVCLHFTLRENIKVVESCLLGTVTKQDLNVEIGDA